LHIELFITAWFICQIDFFILAENRDTQSLISGSGVRHCLGLEISYRHFEENRTASGYKAMKISYCNQPKNPLAICSTTFPGFRSSMIFEKNSSIVKDLNETPLFL